MYESCDRIHSDYDNSNIAGFGLPVIKDEKQKKKIKNLDDAILKVTNNKIESYQEIINNLHSKIDRLENTIKELDKLCKDLSDENKNLRVCIENQRQNIRTKNEVLD